MPSINERLLYGRTLIVTDLVFNYVSAETFGTKLFLTLDGALGPAGPRILRLCIKDKAAARASIERHPELGV